MRRLLLAAGILATAGAANAQTNFTPGTVPSAGDLNAALNHLDGLDAQLSGGSNIRYCSVTGCVSGAHMFGQLVTAFTSTRDSSVTTGAQESGIAVNVTARTGFLSGSDSINNGKAGVSIGMLSQPGSGNVWALDADTVIQFGVGKQFAAVAEFDLNNDNADCAIGVQNCVNLFMDGSSGYPATAGLWITAAAPTTYQYHNGIFLQGSNAVEDNAISDATSGRVSYAISGSHASADIFHNPASTPYGELLNGTITIAGVSDGSNSPIAFQVTGTHSDSDFNTSGSGPAGLNVSGAHTLAAVNVSGDKTPVGVALAQGQKACFNGLTACVYYSASAGKWYFTDENSVVVASIAKTTGNARFLGTVTGSVTP